MLKKAERHAIIAAYIRDDSDEAWRTLTERIFEKEPITVGLYVQGGTVQAARASFPHVRIGIIADVDVLDGGGKDEQAAFNREDRHYSKLPHAIL